MYQRTTWESCWLQIAWKIVICHATMSKNSALRNYSKLPPVFMYICDNLKIPMIIKKKIWRTIDISLIVIVKTPETTFGVLIEFFFVSNLSSYFTGSWKVFQKSLTMENLCKKPEKSKRKRKPRKIIYFNPLFSKSVKTNVIKLFLGFGTEVNILPENP